jgi:hypothetical protein
MILYLIFRRRSSLFGETEFKEPAKKRLFDMYDDSLDSVSFEVSNYMHFLVIWRQLLAKWQFLQLFEAY